MILNKNAKENGQPKKYTIEETTNILAQFGLSQSKWTTQKLIREGKLKAVPNGKNPNDRRASHSVFEKDLYECVMTMIPALKDFYDKIETLEKEVKAKATSQKKATTPRKRSSNPQTREVDPAVKEMIDDIVK